MSEEHSPAAGLDPAADAAAASAVPNEPATSETAEPVALAETAPPQAAPQEPPAAEPPAAPIKPHTDEPGLLQAAAPEQPAETAAEAEEKPAEAAAAEAPAYEFAVPEGFTVAPERLDELQTLMHEAHVSTEHAGKLWDMHTAAMTELAQHLEQRHHDTFAEYRKQERLKIMADPDYGGAGFETSRATANRMLDLMARDPGGNPDKTAANIQELNSWLATSGSSDNYAFFKALMRLARKHDEPQSGPPPSPSPLPPRQAQGRPPRGATAADLSATGSAGRFEYTYPRGGNR